MEIIPKEGKVATNRVWYVSRLNWERMKDYPVGIQKRYGGKPVVVSDEYEHQEIREYLEHMDRERLGKECVECGRFTYGERCDWHEVVS